LSIDDIKDYNNMEGSKLPNHDDLKDISDKCTVTYKKRSELSPDDIVLVLNCAVPSVTLNKVDQGP
jgi:hypothetical protein